MGSSRGLRRWWGSKEPWAPTLNALKNMVTGSPAAESGEAAPIDIPETPVATDEPRVSMTEAVNGAKIRPKTKAAMKKRPARVKSETGVMAKVKPAEALSNVSNRVKRVFERERSSRSAAHGRLKAVMLQDRTTLAAESLDALKNHLLLLLANYVTVDRRRMEMDIKQSGESLLLTASVRVPLFNEVPGENAPEVPPRANEWLLSHKRTLALKRELLEAVGSYMPIFPDSAEVHEKHYSDYALLLTSVRVADGMGYDEDLGGSSIESLFNGNG